MKRFLIPAALMLAACDPAPPQPETGREPNPAFEPQIRAMEKARGAETQMQDAQAARQQQLDAATQ